MSHIDPQIRRLLEADALREPVLRSAIRALELPPGSNGLDVGCGIGLQALLLAEAVGAGGHVTGVDIDETLVAFGEGVVEAAGGTDRVALRPGDMNRLPFADRTFDWAWSADCVGYPLGDLTTPLAEIGRVVKPGGSLAILGWSSQLVLAGHQVLEAELNATCSAYLPYLRGKDPELHFLRAPQRFAEAGLEDVLAHTFLGEVRAPLGEAERAALTSLFEMLWAEPAAAERPGAWLESRPLLTPGSSAFILDEPGYYAFFTYTMVCAKVGGA